MKKKLMMVTLLLAGLTMGACVDDKESASVTAVRDAKTEQLESVATMNAAAAEAKQAMAAAEAALKLAEAQAQQAAAELSKANAEYERKQAELQELRNQQESIDNQRKQAQIEQELLQIEVTKKTIEQQMAQLRADMEEAEIKAQTALINAQARLNRAKESLLNYEKYLASAKTAAERKRIQAERDHLKNLADDYSTAVKALNTARTTLNNTKRSLVTAETGLTTIKETTEANIADWKNQIAQDQIQIDAYKKYANYTEDIDALSLEYTKLEGVKDAAVDNSNKAWNAYISCVVNDDATQELNKIVVKDVLYNLAWSGILVDENRNQYVKSDGTTFTVPSAVSTLRLLKVINSLQTKNLTYTFESEDGKYSNSKNWSLGDSLYMDIEINEDLRQFELDIEGILATNKSNYENATKNVTKWQRLYNGAPTEADYVTGGSATKACRNMVDSTAFLKSEYDKAAAAQKAAAKTKYETQLTAEQRCKSNLDAALLLQADAKLEQDCFDKVVDIIRNFDTYYTALQEKITARNEQSLKDYSEKVDLWMEDQAKDYAESVASANFNAVKAIYKDDTSGQIGAETIDNLIANLEIDIKTLERKIQDLSQIESQEELIEKLKAEIEYQEQKVKVAEINANNAKTALEEALAKYATAEE